MISENKNLNIAISLTGGGARGSYQAGVLKAISEILKQQKMVGKENPIQYWSGVSAGAINATACAAGADDLAKTCENLANVWAGLQPDKVYLTDFRTLSKNSLKWIADLTFGNLVETKKAKSLLDTQPLWNLIEKNINFNNIQKQIDSQNIHGLACSAYSYSDNRTVAYIQADQNYFLNRHRRYSKNVKIKTEHVLASCAIPLLFPSVKIENEYFADGSFRSLSPLSPLIHMGAQKILVVGVRDNDDFTKKKYSIEPGLAHISGLILNSLFFDTIEIDLERVRHINEMVAALQSSIETKRSEYKRIDYYIIRPTKDVGKIAAENLIKFPKLINFLLGSLGPLTESSELASYILFDSSFTKELIEIGYNDVYSQKNELVEWLEK